MSAKRVKIAKMYGEINESLYYSEGNICQTRNSHNPRLREHEMELNYKA